MSLRIQHQPPIEFTIQYPGDNPEEDQRYRDEWENEPPVLLQSDLPGLRSYAICVSQEGKEMWVSLGEFSIEDFYNLTAHECHTLGEMFITAGDILAQAEKEK